MAYLVEYPEINPLQMLPPRASIDVKYDEGYKHYNEWWFKEQLKEWQGTNTKYYQKVQYSDRLTAQWHAANNAEGGALQIVNECGVVVYELSQASIEYTDWTITSQITGDIEPASTFTISPTWQSLGLPVGVYYVVLVSYFNNPSDPNANVDGNVPVIFISEPISLQEVHYNTMLIEYSHSENKAHVFFEEFAGFQLRVEAWLHDLNAQSTRTKYIDESRDVTPIDDVPFNTWTFGTEFVPQWMFNKLNRAWTCDKVKLNHPVRYWTKEDGANWEKNYNPNRGLNSYSISVTPSQNFFAQQSEQQEPLTVFYVENNGDNGEASRFPYFVHSWQLNRTAAPPVVGMYQLNGVNNIIQYSKDCIEVKSAAEELELLNHANNVTRNQYLQSGYYDFHVDVDGNAGLYYYPSNYELNYSSQTYVVLVKRFRFSYLNTGWVGGQRCDITGSYIGYAFLYQDGDRFNGKYGNGNPNITYMVGGSTNNLLNQESFVYHYRQQTATHTIKEIIANYDTYTPNIKLTDGELPASLEVYIIRTGTANGACVSIDFDIFSPCNAAIQYITLDRNRIIVQQNLNTYVGGGMPQLFAIILTNNRLPAVGATGVDTFFNNVWNAGSPIYALTGGILATKFQTPSATPTAASSVARAGIIGDGWTVITD